MFKAHFIHLLIVATFGVAVIGGVYVLLAPVVHALQGS